MNEHEKWLSRRAYHETFSSPSSLFVNWRGLPNRCKCGCGDIWYDRLSPVNWWTYFTPNLLAQVQFLFPVFRALYGLVWHLPPVIWIWFQLARSSYKTEILARTDPNYGTSVTIAIARLLLYGIIAPLIVVVYVATWILTRLGGVIIMGLHLASLALLAMLILTLFGIAVIAISMRGLVFVIGGVASVVLSYYPAIGVTLIIAGVFVEYERNRRSDRQREELLGNLALKLKARSHEH